MPLYKVQWDGVGFTNLKSRTENEMTEAEAAKFTRKLKKAGQIPEGVLSVFHASVAPDEKHDGEWKVFVGIELIVEAADMLSVERSEAPEDFLLLVADKMSRQDADSAYGLRGSFEILEVEDWEGPAPTLA